MPAKAKTRGPRQTTKCKCGCGQGSAGRSRKVTCSDGHYSAFVPRSAIAMGVGTCWCGEPLEPTCLDDRCYLPGTAGEAAMVACSGMDTGPARVTVPSAHSASTRCRACQQFTGKGRGATCPHCGFSDAGGYALARRESLREAMPF
jgi:hypothetical protein